MRALAICDDSNPRDVVELCRDRGLGIEVQALYHSNALSDEPLRGNTVAMVADLPLVAMHGPCGDLNPGSIDPLVREVARQRTQAGYDIALRFGAGHIVYHPGRVPV